MEEILRILFGGLAVFCLWWWANHIPLTKSEKWYYQKIHGRDEDQADSLRQRGAVILALVFAGMVLLKVTSLVLGLDF